MKRLVVALILGCAAQASFCEIKQMDKLPDDLSGLMYSEVPKNLREEYKARKRIQRLQRTGGRIFRKGTPKGKVVFFDAQNRVAASEPLAKAAETAHKKLRLTFETQKIGKVSLTTASETMRKAQATAAVFLVDDEQMPVGMLVAPNECWAFVNVTALTKDKPASTFEQARIRKEVLRAFFAAAGGSGSQFMNTLVGDVKAASDLDQLVEGIPVDLINRTLVKLRGRGMAQEEMCTYLDACQEGWAPAPTNDIQKAVWEKVHTSPKNPMKIEFDPKKGR